MVQLHMINQMPFVYETYWTYWTCWTCWTYWRFSGDSDCPPSHQANQAQACWQLMSALAQDQSRDSWRMLWAMATCLKIPKGFIFIRDHRAHRSNAMW